MIAPPDAPIEIGLGLGSNVGDKVEHIRHAAALLQSTGTVADVVLSSLYRTAPWGPVDQDWFVNACLCGTTRLSPPELLVRVKALEAEIGRTATIRWGPRVIDIDVLYYGDVELESPDLVLPHRELINRAFVLLPLAEIRPALTIGGRALGPLLARLGDQEVVRLDREPPAG